jgi:hypothetical protein
MILPAYLDRYLAKNVFCQQETRTPVSATRQDNLMTPVTGLHRTRGRFGNEAADSAVITTGSVARLLPVLAAALGGFSLGLLVGRRRRPNPARVITRTLSTLFQ